MPYQDIQPDNNAYVIACTGEEVARLLLQAQLSTKSEGGVSFLKESQYTDVRTIVDLACGPGCWALDVASTYRQYTPPLEVVGVDINKHMVEYATDQAKWLLLSSTVSFQEMDITQPLDFPNESFDLVNARFLGGFLSREQWPTLIAECKRILRPGGFLRLTETEMGISTSPALDKFLAILLQAFYQSGKSFNSVARETAITPVLRYFLAQAGFSDIHITPHIGDCSFGTEDHRSYCKNAEVVTHLLRDFLLQWQVTTQEELECLRQQILIEMYQPNFCGLTFFLTALGKKGGVI